MLLSLACSKIDDAPDDSRAGLLATTKPVDPFEIHNILSAFRSLQERDTSVNDFDIKPNHIYVRFMPRNESELEQLRSDTTIVLFDYPLNTEDNDSIINPVSSFSESGIQYQYSVLPIDKKIPSVRYEILYEVFLPPSDNITKKNASDNFFEKLVNESARLTGNISEFDTIKSARSSKKRWSPGGRVRVWDDFLNMYIPVCHVNVHARWFTHIESALTDDEGYFRMSSFTHAVNYSIKWENSRFTIRDGLFFQAWYNGPKMKGDWFLDIIGGKSKMFATIHRAAYRQFYGDNLGLFRPTLNSGGRTKICYMDGDGTGVFKGDFSGGGLLPDIKIWGSNSTKPSNFIFACATHELGHQAHSQYIGNFRYIKVSQIIKESWAEAVEWAITNDEYHKLGQKYGNRSAIGYDHQFGKHAEWPLVPDRNYSPAFIDLIDDFNQGEAFGKEYPDDKISQYTILYLNRYILPSSTDINSLREELIKHKPEGVDDDSIRDLYLLY